MTNRPNQSSNQESEGGLSARVRDAADQVKSAARERAQSVRSGADNARETAAKRLRKLGAAVSAISETIRIDEPYVAEYARSTSERIDKFATYLNETETQEVIHDVERFVQRRPGLMVGGALMLGLVTGRFLKGSSALLTDDGGGRAAMTRRDQPSADASVSEDPAGRVSPPRGKPSQPQRGASS
jgi:ElaB/YqjD/DUF883 family membrane-anchored ribosome-binding protein